MYSHPDGDNTPMKLFQDFDNPYEQSVPRFVEAVDINILRNVGGCGTQYNSTLL